jgi:hypothetical protein
MAVLLLPSFPIASTTLLQDQQVRLVELRQIGAQVIHAWAKAKGKIIIEE